MSAADFIFKFQALVIRGAISSHSKTNLIVHNNVSDILEIFGNIIFLYNFKSHDRIFLSDKNLQQNIGP